MTRVFTSVPVVLWILSAAAVHAQTTLADTPSLALSAAIDEALERNSSLRATRAATDAAVHDAAVARSSLFPRVTFNETWQRGDQPVFVFSSLLASRRFAASNFAIDALNHPDASSYFHTSIGLEQVLFDGGARRASVDSARAQQQSANLSAREASLALVARLTQTYGQLLTAQSARAAADAAVASAREDLARAERRRDVGTASDADVLSLRLHVADMQQRAIAADADLVTFRAQLNQITGAPIDRAFRATDPAFPPADDLPVGDLLALADANRPELQQALVAQRIAADTQRTAHAALLPQVVAQAAFDISGTRVSDRATSWLAGGELRWSLSSGGAERARMKAAAANAARATAAAEEARSQIQVEIVQAAQQLRSARARQAVAQAAVAEAHESHRITVDRYDAGLVPVNDVLRVSSAVFDAEMRRTAALVDEMTARAQLDRAIGRTPGDREQNVRNGSAMPSGIGSPQ